MTTKDKSNQFDQDSSFWEDYNRGRPNPPDSFFDRILAYHSDHGGQFGALHDAGAGPAVHTTRLSRRFEKVLVSDPSSSNIEAAKARLRHEPNCQFALADLEKTGHLEAGSVDLLFACNCIHLADDKKALDAARYQLKPGGSFVTAAFGRLILEDEELDLVWRKVFHQIIEIYITDANTGARMRSTLKTSSSNYDSLYFDPSYWLPGVQRIRLNLIRNLDWRSLIISPARDKDFPFVDRKGMHDVVIEEEVEGWRAEFDFAKLKQHLKSFITEQQEDERFRELLGEMERAIGDRTVGGVFPCLLVMATRR